jgi:3-hydroxyisobutyrate dehydrogenase-like beta-hydroxyacid dehydrogenase
MTYTIGFIGLGTMGRPMVQHLINRGHRLKLYARRPEVFEHEARHLVDQGASVVSSLVDFASDCDFIITNVLGTTDVQSVLIERSDAIIHSAPPQSMVIDHSTIDPRATQTIAQRFADARVQFVDAPVSGGVWAAEAGELVSMLGGTTTACSKAIEVIAAYTKAQTRVGESGHGQIAKLANQIAQTITIQGVAESLTFARTMGADPQSVFEAIKDGMGGSPMMSLLAPKMITAEFQAGIAARLHAKDAAIAEQAASQAGQTLPCLELVSALYTELLAAGDGDADTAKLITRLASRSVASQTHALE